MAKRYDIVGSLIGLFSFMAW